MKIQRINKTTSHIVLHPCRLRPLATQPARPLLSELMLRGRGYHPLVRGAFVRRVGWFDGQLGTCALAAAYAGHFGPEAINGRLAPSYIIYELSRVTGVDIRNQLYRYPGGGYDFLQNICINLVDVWKWNRRGVASWLRGIGL